MSNTMQYDTETTFDMGMDDTGRYGDETTVAGGDTILSWDDEFSKILKDNGITLDIRGGARLDDMSDDLIIPVTGGEITSQSLSDGMAEIEHRGSGIMLTHDDVTVELDDLVINTGMGTIHGDPIILGVDNPLDLTAPEPTLFNLDDSVGIDTSMEVMDDATVISESPLSLSREAAELLNRAFHIDALHEGERVGTATVRLSTA